MTTNRSSRRRPAVMFGAALVCLALVAGACSDKKDEESGGSVAPPASAEETTAETTAETTGDTTAETTAETTEETTEETEATTEETEATEPAKEVVPGGTLIVSGEAEVANPWTPAAMQCDSYCQQRARTFYDPLAALGADNQVHPYLAESITPNDEFTEWTVKLREGISFTDGTPLNADAAIQNLQVSGTGLLIANALTDVAKNEDGSLKIEKVDDLTFVIYTGKGGDASQPLPWPGFALYLAGQWGFIASPTWLDAVTAGTAEAAMPVGTGPFMVESYAPADKLVVVRNPDYWQTDAAGNQLPYLDKIEFRVIEDSEIAADALRSGDIDIFSTSAALVIADFREDAEEFPMREQDEYTETNYLLIDLDKVGPLQDARVRCALSKAINRQEIIDATAGGILTPANGLFSAGQEGYLEDNGFSVEQDLEGAQALIDEYTAETGESVSVNYGTTTSQINGQVAELLTSYWGEIGVQTEYQQVPQDSFITDALFGNANFFIFGWRNHAGLYVDSQYFWWHSSAAAPEGSLALNFGRVRDEVVDENLAIARSDPDAAKRKEAAENINRRMAEQCYQIPVSWTLWGTPHAPKVQGLGETTLPDGTKARDGAGFSGQFWTNSIWIDESA